VTEWNRADCIPPPFPLDGRAITFFYLIRGDGSEWWRKESAVRRRFFPPPFEDRNSSPSFSAGDIAEMCKEEKTSVVPPSFPALAGERNCFSFFSFFREA